jgi:hypothetical protein
VMPGSSVTTTVSSAQFAWAFPDHTSSLHATEDFYYGGFRENSSGSQGPQDQQGPAKDDPFNMCALRMRPKRIGCKD